MQSLKITVFGGAHLPAHSPGYQQAFRLGNLLASRGHTTISGGYGGTMEAVSRGAAEAGGHVVGVTCGEITKSHHHVPNKWIQEEIYKETLLERLVSLIRECDAAIAMPGGAGTLNEIAFMWSLMIVKSIPRVPLVLVGKGWRSLLATLANEQSEFLSPSHQDMLTVASGAEDAILAAETQYLALRGSNE